MYVVRHERPSVDVDLIPFSCFFEPASKRGDVIIASKTDLAVIATLDDVLRNPNRGDPASSWHVLFFLLLESRLVEQREL